MFKSKKSLFDYDNYREFLGDFYKESKARDRKFSFRFFARSAEFSSPSFLKHVMEGKKNLSLESIDKCAGAMKLNKEETEFFRNLVQFNQAVTIEEKTAYSKEMMRSRTFRKLHPLKLSQVSYLTQWYYIPIRELVGLPKFREDPKWIAKQLEPNIDAQEAKQALEVLLRLGLLTRTEDGKLVQADRNITVLDEFMSTSLAQCHRELIKKGSESIDRVPRERREISAVTLRVSAAGAQRIKEMIQNFRNDIVQEAANDTNPDCIFQLNLQLFPLAAIKEGDES